MVGSLRASCKIRRWSSTNRKAALRASELGVAIGVLGCSASCQSKSEYVIRSVCTPPLTVATILSTTSCPLAEDGRKQKAESRRQKAKSGTRRRSSTRRQGDK